MKSFGCFTTASSAVHLLYIQGEGIREFCQFSFCYTQLVICNNSVLNMNNTNLMIEKWVTFAWKLLALFWHNQIVATRKCVLCVFWRACKMKASESTWSWQALIGMIYYNFKLKTGYVFEIKKSSWLHNVRHSIEADWGCQSHRS